MDVMQHPDGHMPAQACHQAPFPRPDRCSSAQHQASPAGRQLCGPTAWCVHFLTQQNHWDRLSGAAACAVLTKLGKQGGPGTCCVPLEGCDAALKPWSVLAWREDLLHAGSGIRAERGARDCWLPSPALNFSRLRASMQCEQHITCRFRQNQCWAISTCLKLSDSSLYEAGKEGETRNSDLQHVATLKDWDLVVLRHM